MALVSQMKLQHTPASVEIYAALFTGVQNSSFLRAQLLAGNAEFSYAFIDARSVLSTTHLLAAVFRAINDHEAGRLKSRNIHSEIVFSLSPNNNIADSFKRFGISGDTKDLIVVKVGGLSGASERDMPTLESVTAHLTANVQGTPVALNDITLRACSDLNHIAKLYKVPLGNSSSRKKNPKVEVEQSSRENALNGQITVPEAEIRMRHTQVVALGAMALKGS